MDNKRVEELVFDFFVKNENICREAYNAGWLGNIWRSNEGLLGYMRYSYKKQQRILLLNNNQIEPTRYVVEFPFFENEATLPIKLFFNSDFFKKSVLENNEITHFYKKEHFDILKKLYKTKINLDFQIIANCFKKKHLTEEIF